MTTEEEFEEQENEQVEQEEGGFIEDTSLIDWANFLRITQLDKTIERVVLLLSILMGYILAKAERIARV